MGNDLVFVIVLLGGIWLGFLFRTIYDILKIRNTRVKARRVFLEVYDSINKSYFITRVNNTVTINTTINSMGEIDLIYMIDKNDIAIFKNGVCYYSSLSLDDKDTIINDIIIKITTKHSKNINDVVNLFGFIFSKVDFETKFKMKYENGTLYPLDNKVDESDISKIIKNNSNKFSIDEILDKINTYGFDKLSNDEKGFLKNFKG